MTIGIRTKLLTLAAVSTLVACAMGGVGWWTTAEVARGTQELHRISSAVRALMRGDMMHDAIRSDLGMAIVYATRGDEAKCEAIVQDYLEHAETFRSSLEEVRQRLHEQELLEELAVVTAKVEEYLAVGERSITLVVSDPTAGQGELAAFEAIYEELEGVNETFGDHLEQASAEELASDAALLTWTHRTLLVSGLACAALAISVSLIIARSVARSAQRTSEVLEAVSRGDLSRRIEPSSDDELGRMAVSLNGTTSALTNVLTDARSLIEACQRGQLDQRIDASRHQGAFNELTTAINQMLDGVAAPVRETSAALRRLSAGDLSARVDANFQGEFRTISDSLNETADVLRRVIAETHGLIEATRTGRLSERGDAKQFQGSYRELCEGVNHMLDAVATPMSACSQALRRIAAGDLSRGMEGQFEGDFRVMQASLEHTIGVLRQLLAEADKLIASAKAGELERRIDTSRSEGAYRSLAEGMNEMLEGVALPVRETSRALERMARGDLSRVQVQEFAGEYAAIQRNLESTLAVLRHLTSEVQRLTVAARAGELSERIDAERFEGGYRDLCAGINQMVESMLAPVRSSLEVLERVAERDLQHKVEGQYQGEHAKLQAAVNAAVDELANALVEIHRSSGALQQSSSKLGSVSDRMGREAREASSQAGAAASAAQQISQTVQTVAAGAEEMSASIMEIAKNVTQAARVAQEAVEAANQTNATVTKLGSSSAEIGQVIKVITSIAQQTNLLALNATIEAARAGDAGRGFAVVANEVKELANQTSSATEEISRKIEAIQGDVRGSIDAIGHISAVIQQVSQYQTAIAGAVEEQTATTNEISRNVNEAALGTSEIARNISQVAESTSHTLGDVDETRGAAGELTTMATQLSTLVERFQLR